VKPLNNNGQMAFFARLADGRTGIYRADPHLLPHFNTPIVAAVGQTIRIPIPVSAESQSY